MSSALVSNDPNRIDTFKIGLDEAQTRRLENLRKFRVEQIDFEGYEETLYGEFVEFLDQRTQSIKQVNHYIRYCRAFKKIYGDLHPGVKIGEAGGFSAVSDFLVEKGYDCNRLLGDLRYKIDYPDDQLDFLFSFETLEHIKDHNSDVLNEIVVFNFSGMKSYMSEMARTLKPGGHLILTTPNPNSLLVMDRLMNFRPVLMAAVHVREMTKPEIVQLADPYFDVQIYDTMFCYQVLRSGPGSHQEALYEALRSLGADLENRGDTHFFKLQKRV